MKLLTYNEIKNKSNMKEFDINFNIGDTVYLKTDSPQEECLVTGIKLRKSSVTYGLSKGSFESWHYDFKISIAKDIMKNINS